PHAEPGKRSFLRQVWIATVVPEQERKHGQQPQNPEANEKFHDLIPSCLMTSTLATIRERRCPLPASDRLASTGDPGPPSRSGPKPPASTAEVVAAAAVSGST